MHIFGPVIAAVGFLNKLFKGDASSLSQTSGDGSIQAQQSGSGNTLTINYEGASADEFRQLTEAVGQLSELDFVGTSPSRRTGTESKLPGMLISQVTISASGDFIGESRNITSLNDGSFAGERDIHLTQAYATPNYHVSIGPPGTRANIVKTASFLSIQILDDGGNPIDKTIDVLIVGEG